MDATLNGLYILECEKVPGSPASVTSSPGVYGDDPGGSSLHEGPTLYRFRQGFSSLVRNASCLRLHGQCDSQGAFQNELAFTDPTGEESDLKPRGQEPGWQTP